MLQFSWVNQKIEVRQSQIEGNGLFANKKIEKGEIVIVQSGRIISNSELNKKYKRFLRICFPITQDLHICPYQPQKKYCDGAFLMNHSCDPNCGIKGQVIFVALRKIQKGEELTYDYAMTDASPKDKHKLFDDMKCNCGTKKCRKIITSDDWKNAALQKKYGDNFSDFIISMQRK